MSAFQVSLTPEAQADIGRLDPARQTRSLNKLKWLVHTNEIVPFPD